MGSSASIGAAQGIQAWMRVFDRSAAAITGGAAQISNEAADPTGSGGSDMIDGMIGMSFAAAGVKANIAVLRTADEMLGTLLDMRA